jgi:hypothetical protein
MITLLFISGSVICALLYRSLTRLLRQVPNRNEDFDAFFSQAELDRISSAATDSTRNAQRLEKEVSARNSASAIV